MKMIDIRSIRGAAQGRWPFILSSLGIPAEVLNKRRNQPCPACGGRDRFQFIDKGIGRFVCRAIERQGGNGFDLVMHYLNCDFHKALKAVAGTLDIAGMEAPNVQPCGTLKTEQHYGQRNNHLKIGRLWDEAWPIRHNDIVDRYLRLRGLEMKTFPSALRFHPALPFWCNVEEQPLHITDYPAMLAELSAPNGSRIGLHRVFLTQDGHKAQPTHPLSGEALPCKKLLVAFEGASHGAAIRLDPPEHGTLALAEGIETALASRLGSGLPTWACVSAGGLQRIVLPKTVHDVHIMADHDKSGTGQRAAQILAKRLMNEGRRVRIHIPSQPGTDWLDVYQQKMGVVA
ncbi:DUF7146 domain-containing protein [Pseudogulbenkiania ferrooxidans]|uniref:P4 alpha zinc-binding domain protein n=1 Tax=Pseudogulbenkiania ferrooxidans 2002 TaxID=279714 RepID=B9Z295_9NEIS|nr:toprim domain-containing protein [Pseudogulbenkiania ferrooxidans]EEG09540.1 P4 alpha zinc-binding domain protein [Pseudogulbenkiania ferrooxidans 2002]